MVRTERIEFTNGDYFNRMKKLVENDRIGEVVFCVIRPNGKIITVTCEEYPEGIYRIPSGGIGYNEDVIDALFREVKEELGIDVEIVDSIGVLKIEFCYKNQETSEYETVNFYSYLFILREIGGNLLSDALDNEISGVREVDLKGLEEIVESLNNIEGKWRDWGKFRYITSKAILNYFKKM